MKTFAEIAQMNVDFYNEHPRAHAAITVAYGVTAAVSIHGLIKRLTQTDADRRCP